MQRNFYQHTTYSFEAIFLLGLLIAMIVFTAIWIFASIWIGKQAKIRGMDSPTLWVFISLMFPVLGWIVFLFLMPGGLSIPCDICGQKKLETLLKCPHCGYPTKTGQSVQDASNPS